MIQIREVIIEPNKTYVNQKFKVKIRVQDDYKYRKRTITENVKIRTLTASDFIITDADTSRKANIVEIQGNTVQDGTPSPDNEVEVQNVTGDNYIVVSNANLFNPNGISKTVSGVSLSNNYDGTYTANGTATASVSIPLILDPETIKLKANSSYIWSIEVLSGSSSGNVSFPVAVRKDDGTTMYNYLSVRPNTEKYSDRKTSTENLTLREVAMYVPNGVTINNLIFRLQLREGTTATDYIEHQGKKYRANLDNLELCKIGTYRDYVYKSNNKWYKHTAIGKVVLDNNSNIRIQDIITTNNKFIWRYSNVIDMAGTGTRSNIYSNYFVGNTNVYGANDLIGAYVNNSNLTNFAMLLSTVGATTSNTTAEVLVMLKAWLSTHTVLLYYPLTEPIEEEITNENLIAQLEELQRITMYDELTYVDFNGKVKATMELEYATIEELKKYIVTENGKILRTDWGE